jgi:hypothetical protein
VHQVHVKKVGSPEGVDVHLVCTQGPAAAGRLGEPHVVLRSVPGRGAAQGADVWLPAGEAGQLAVIFAQLGHRGLARLVAGAAVEVGA